MRRRSFIKRLPLLASSPFVLNNIPLHVLAKNGHLQRLAATSANDKVLVLIQLHGGNDGLNTLIPLDQYADYYNLRPNLAIADNGPRKYIPLDGNLATDQQIGLHPDLQSLKELYDRGRVSIVQNVAYENMNGSHFRSRDIWFMGGNYNEYLDSGWMGRYLDHEYPGYPDDYPNAQMPDPLAIEIGNSVSLAFHRGNGIPASLSIRNPDQFFNLVKSVGGQPPESIEDTHYGDELRYILQVEEKSNQYAEQLKEIYEMGTNSPGVVYPELYPFNAPKGRLKNGLAPQLKMIARLLSGGVKTKIFLARIGGFDTHAEQVEEYDASMGNHAALLYHLSSAVQAFQNDLRELGLEDKVLTLTFSEFGRRAKSNGSFGSDHGNAAPMFVFGKHVNPGVFGNVPDLNDLDRGNLRMNYDYRRVFTSIAKDWLEADAGAIDATRFGDWVDDRLPLIGNGITSSNEAFFKDRNYLRSCYPNPVKDQATFTFKISQAQHIDLTIYDINGREVEVLHRQVAPVGEQKMTVDLSHLVPGTYIYELKTGDFTESKKFVKE